MNFLFEFPIAFTYLGVAVVTIERAKMMCWKVIDLGVSGALPHVWSCDKHVFLLEHMPIHLVPLKIILQIYLEPV